MRPEECNSNQVFDMLKNKQYKGEVPALQRLFSKARTHEERAIIKKVQDRSYGSVMTATGLGITASDEVSRPSTTLRTLVAICEFMDMRLTNNRMSHPRYEAYVSYSKIARKAGCSRRTVIRHVKALESLGLIKVWRRRDKSDSRRNKINRFRPGTKMFQHLAKFTATRLESKYSASNTKGRKKSITEEQRKEARERTRAAMFVTDDYLGGGDKSDTEYHEDIYLATSKSRSLKNYGNNSDPPV